MSIAINPSEGHSKHIRIPVVISWIEFKTEIGKNFVNGADHIFFEGFCDVARDTGIIPRAEDGHS